MTFFRLLAYAAAATTGITGGVLFAFSTMVMPSLRQLPATDAVRAMQAINRQAPRSAFMVPLLGSVLACATVGVGALVSPRTPGRPLLIAGAAAGIAVFAITAACHLPRNDALALVDPVGPAATAAWADFEPGWTAWNHVRSAAGLVAAALFIAASRVDLTP